MVRIYREDEALGEAAVGLRAGCGGAAGRRRPAADARRGLSRGRKKRRGIAGFEKLTALEPDVPEHWCALGNARLAAGDPGEAEAAYLRAAELDPADAAAFFSRLADGCLRAGYPEQAQATLVRCLALSPDEPLYRMALGDVLIRLGKPDAAADAYARAAALDPAAAGGCWNRLGNRLAQRRASISRRRRPFAKAVAAEPDNPRYLLRLAASYAAGV